MADPDAVHASAGWNDHAVAYDALSVRQPWVHAIAHLGKRIENRNWPLGKATPWIGRRVAIHASQKIDDDSVSALRATGYDVPDRLPVSAIVAVAHLAQVMAVVHARARFPDQAPWISGPLCLVLENVLVLPRPVGCAGQLGWWLMGDRVRLDVAAQVRELEAARG